MELFGGASAKKAAQDHGFLPTRRSLISRLKDLDDQKSWLDFFDIYWKLIYRAATKAGLSDSEAEDVVQETILTITRRIQEFKYDPALGSFKGWLLHTTRWRILDHVRRRAREPAAQSVLDGGDPTSEAVEAIPDPTSACVEAVWETEWRQNLMDAAIRRVKRQVQPKHYQVFEVYALKEWPIRKVALTFGVCSAQVHLIKHRVGKLIRREIKRLESEGI